jgi:hypothetical protein
MIRDGKVVRTVMSKFRIDEISAVDRPAQVEAKAQILKRDKALAGGRNATLNSVPSPEEEKRRRQQYSKALTHAVTTATAGHAHIIVGMQAGADGVAEKRSGVTSFADGHSHSWVMDDAGNIVIADEMGHTHGIAILVQKNEIDQGTLAALDELTEQVASETAETIGDSGESMSDQNDKAVDPAVQAQIEQLTKRADRAEAVLALSADQFTFFKGLGSEAQEQFLSLDSEGRKAEIAKAQEADPVIYTSEDGEVFRKSDDQRLVKAVKQMDDERKRRKQMEERERMSGMRKRAEGLRLPGDDEAKFLLVKAVSGLTEDEQEKAFALLNANADRLAKALDTIGTSEQTVAEDPVQPIADQIRKAHPELTPEQAYSKALMTPEGARALLESRS